MNRTLRERIGLISFFAVLLVFLGLAAVLLAPLSGPLLCALSAAIILWPVHLWIGKRLPKRSPGLHAFISTFAVLILIVGPLIAITSSLTNEAVGLWPVLRDNLIAMKGHLSDPTSPPPAWASHLPAGLAHRIVDIVSRSHEKLIEYGNRFAQSAAHMAASFAVNVLVLFANIALFEFVLFFLLRDGDRLLVQWNELLPFPEDLKKKLIRRAASVIQGVFRGIVIVGLVQTLTMSIAYLIVGSRAIVLLAGLTAIGTLVPGIGSGLVWIPLVLYYFFKGVLWKAVLLIVFGLVAGTIDNILRPIIAGPKMELPLLWFLLAILGGVQFFGVLGLLLGPMIFAILPILLDVYRAYMKESAS
jgi:predicted PurR-regulated permease PerM